MVELEKFLDNPLAYYTEDISDLFLLALGNAFKVNVTVFQSNTEGCWIADSSKDSSDLRPYILREHCRLTLNP